VVKFLVAQALVRATSACEITQLERRDASTIDEVSSSPPSPAAGNGCDLI
jgi:hypothetical protein